jgi:hypothetical protein
VWLFLAFIFPVGIYCLILGILNRRDQPILVSGPWDFAGILFAASGVLLIVGPFYILRPLYDQWRYYWLMDHPSQGESLNGPYYYLWLTLWFVYYIGVVIVSAWMLNRRREITAVYNVDQSLLEVGLSRVFERLGLYWRKNGNHFILNSQSSDGSALEVEGFPPLRHATLRWHGVDEPTRQAIVSELEKVLAGMPVDDSSVAGWFLSLGVSVMFVTLASVTFVIYLNWRRIRG